MHERSDVHAAAPCARSARTTTMDHMMRDKERALNNTPRVLLKSASE
jgi:hypothetical protein